MAKPAAKKPRRSRGGVPSDLKHRIAWHRAWLHLRAYTADSDPRHIVDACIAFLEGGVDVPVEMLPNLRILRRDLDARLRGKPGTGYRAMLIAAHVIQRHGEIPADVPNATIAAIAREHGMSKPAVKMAITRLRKRLS